MTFVIQGECVGVKDAACVEVCPVECIYEAEPQEKYKNLPMFIHPEECIDCLACESECPVEAIRVDDEAEEPWITLNSQLAEVQDGL
tara:strand:- start:304 stop:564 length:261 start_codon:yes stop_codon:yes gene_type:complete